MSPDASHSTTTGTADRRQAVWPWLLLPLVALTLFFALRTVKPLPAHHAAHAESADALTSDAAEATPSEDTGSP